MTQNEALTILKAGHNVFLTGAAGSGKTYVLNACIKHLKERGANVGITASTGIAATHLNGLTIHSFAGIGIKRAASEEEIKMMASNKRVAKRLKKLNVLVIDEISMLDADRLDLAERVIRRAKENTKPFGGVQVILCGDFFQLPPVAKVGESPPQFAYKSAAWEALNLKTCYLHEQHRQGDQDFLEILNTIRGAAVDDKVRFKLNSRMARGSGNAKITKLYSHNKDVDSENLKELNLIQGKETCFTMEERGVPAILESLKKGCLAPERLLIKKGASVMFVKNNFERGYVNGTLGTVTGFEGGFPVVTTAKGKKILATPAEWSIEDGGKILAQIIQIPLRLAWAITIHKSQGMTLDAAQVDLSGAFEPGMGYVALSRVRTLADMRLVGLNDTALQVNPEILELDRLLKEQSEEVVKMIQKMPALAKSDIPTPKYLDHSAAPYAEIRKSYPAAYAKWNTEEDEALRRGFAENKPMETLAKIHQRKPGAIRSRLIKLGLVTE